MVGGDSVNRYLGIFIRIGCTTGGFILHLDVNLTFFGVGLLCIGLRKCSSTGFSLFTKVNTFTVFSTIPNTTLILLLWDRDGVSVQLFGDSFLHNSW